MQQPNNYLGHSWSPHQGNNTKCMHCPNEEIQCVQIITKSYNYKHARVHVCVVCNMCVSYHFVPRGDSSPSVSS